MCGQQLLYGAAQLWEEKLCSSSLALIPSEGASGRMLPPRAASAQ